MGTKYELSTEINGNMFFARRVRKWLMDPEQDRELEKEIRSGKYPELECLLPENNDGDAS